MIYSATAKGPFKVAGVIDPNAKKTVGLIYKPDAWVANTVYYVRAEDDYDIAVPSVFAGLYYKATNPGKSAATEPVWPTTPGSTVTDGTVVWEAVAYNLLPYTESITTSDWTATDGVTLSNKAITGGKTQCMISVIPAAITSFSITNHIVKSNNEEDDITLQFKVASR